MPVAVVPINLATNTSGSPIPFTGVVSAIAIAPDDQTAYVANDTYAGTIGTFVVPINLNTATSGAPISFSRKAAGIAITPDGLTAYVTQGQSVVPINLSNNTLEAPIPLPTGTIAQHIVVIG
jgi:DNA-binding beta-propeller fold protein YncE